jgi:hypothetical protein
MKNTNTTDWPLPLLLILELVVTALLAMAAMVFLKVDLLPDAWQQGWLGALLLVLGLALEVPVILMLLRKGRGQNHG